MGRKGGCESKDSEKKTESSEENLDPLKTNGDPQGQVEIYIYLLSTPASLMRIISTFHHGTVYSPETRT